MRILRRYKKIIPLRNVLSPRIPLIAEFLRQGTKTLTLVTPALVRVQDGNHSGRIIPV